MAEIVLSGGKVILRGTNPVLRDGPAGGTALLTLELHETGGEAASTAVHRCGVAFDKGVVPAGQTLRARARGGSEIRCAAGEIATWSDGSLRKATLLLHDPQPIAAGGSRSYDMWAASGAPVRSSFDPWSWLARSAVDAVVSIRNHTGSASGPRPDLDFSWKAAAGFTTRREILIDTPLLVRTRTWHFTPGDAHLVCIWHADFWLATDGATPIAIELTPVMSQHWYKASPEAFPSDLPKERRDYDAMVRWGGTVLDARPGLQHAYHCQWAALYAGDDAQHATRHWVPLSTAAKPTLRRAWDDASRIAMMRAGYLPPLDLKAPANRPAAMTYAPLGNNGHRAAINGTGAYPGRGAVTDFDAQALILQTETHWRNARVAAQAGLAVSLCFRDDRNGADARSLTLIPQVVSRLGPKLYGGLGPETLAGVSLGTGGWPLLPDEAGGGYGSFTNYDGAHQVNYSGAVAFAEGEAYLADATLSMAQTSVSQSWYNPAGNNLATAWYEVVGRRAALSIPDTTYGVTCDYTQQRSFAWGMNCLLWGAGLASDQDRHAAYLRNLVDAQDLWLKVSYDLIPADHRAWGMFFHSTASSAIGSAWMDQFAAICVAPWVKYVEDVISNRGGVRAFTAMNSQQAINAYKSARPYITEAYRTAMPCDSNYLNWLAYDSVNWMHDGVTIFGDTFTTGTPPGGPWQNGDRCYFSPIDANGNSVGVPDGFSRGTTYYMVQVSGNTFKLAASAGGPPVAPSRLTSASIGVSWAGAETTPATAGSYLPNADSFAAIAAAAIHSVWAHTTNPSAVAAHVAASKSFLQNVDWTGYYAWNYEARQIRDIG